MNEECGFVSTRDGRRVAVVRVQLPDEEYAELICGAIDEVHTARSDRYNRCWETFRRHMLERPFGGMVVNVYMGYIGADCVCTVPFYEGAYAAVVEYVLVPQSFRARGICSAVLDLAARDFDRRGGEFVSLGPAPDNVAARRAYSTAGFEPGGLTDPYCVWMSRVLRSDFEEYRFAAGQPCRVRRYKAGDGPKIHALTWALGGRAFGCAYEDLFHEVEVSGRFEAHVLASADETILGFACGGDIFTFSGEGNGTRIIHPEYAHYSAELAKGV